MKKTAQLFFVLFQFIGYFSCFSTEKPYEEVKDGCHLSILSPSLADRKYEKIRLANGINAYLISDPQANQSAAALSLPVGSWDDPKDYPGMAHFLEHMLFNGTKKYPQPLEFLQFISDHGGMPNAFTSVEKTVYSFSINHDAFIDGLDRFAQFFISPLFDPSCVGKELYAVDQEFAKNKEHDGWRFYQVSKEISNPHHPNVLFSTGNAETLKGIPPERLRQWYTSHYSPHLMNLVIYSPLPLDTLKDTVAKLFGNVPSRPGKITSLSMPLLSDTQKGHMVYIPTIRKGKTLLIQWELPKELIHDESQSAKMVCFALSRGHEHSLLEQLKREKLAEDLAIYPKEYGSHHLLVEMEVDLTDEGASEVNTIIQRCYEAIAGVKDAEIPSFLYSEMYNMKKIAYEQQVRENPFSFVEKHASQLVFESLESYPEKTLLPSSLNARKIKKVLASLSPEKGVYFVLADPSFLSSITLDKTEKWMQVPYATIPIAPSLLEQWANTSSNPQITLSPQNPFIPSAIENVSKNGIPDQAIKISQTDRGNVFYHPAESYDEPNVCLSFYIKSPIAERKDFSVMGDLFVQLAQKKLHSTLLQAHAAGLDARLHSASEGLLLEISGYSEKAPLLLQEILRTLQNLHISSEDFSIAVKSLSDHYDNLQKELPLIQANELLHSLLDLSFVPKKEKSTLLSLATYEEMQNFAQEFFAFNFVEGFITGNLSLKDAESLWLDLQDSLAKGAYPKALQPSPKTFAFPNQDGPYCLQQTTEAQGTGLILAIDAGDFSFEKRAAQQILSQAIHDAFFAALRTEQKTAYIVQSWDMEKERHLYHLFAVQSGTHDIEDLLSRFEIFLDGFLQDLEKNISKERFASIQNSLVTLLKTPVPNLKDFLQRQRQLAFDFDEDFQWMDKRIEATSALTYEQLLSYAESILSKSNRKRIAIEVQGVLEKGQTLRYTSLSLDSLRSKGQYQAK